MDDTTIPEEPQDSIPPQMKVMVEALACLLSDSEGVFLGTEYGPMLVSKQGQLIVVQDASEYADFAHGQVCWVHNRNRTTLPSDVPRFRVKKTTNMVRELTPKERAEALEPFCEVCWEERSKDGHCTCWNKA